MTNIRSDAEAAAARVIPPPPVLAQGVASFQRIDLPLNQSTDAAWAVVDESAFPALTRGVWNANGLRIGLLPRSDVDTFVRKLPPAQGISRSRLIGSSHPSPILRTPRLTGYATIDLTIPPMAVNEADVTGGRLQLLARLTHDEGGALVLDLLPHHYVPKITLEPRTAMEKELDGRIFKRLALRVRIPPTHMLVVGLYRPWPTPQPSPASPPAAPPTPAPSAEPAPSGAVAAEPTPGSGGTSIELRADDQGRVLTARQLQQQQQKQEDSAPSPAAPPPADPPPLSNHLGRAFFVTSRFDRPLQTIMLVTIEPLPTAPPEVPPQVPPQVTPGN